MRPFVTRFPVLLCLIAIGYTALAFAQETITIPKARLEELERKEAELEKLKGESGKAQAPSEISTSKRPDEAAPNKNLPQTPPAPAPVGETPALASLPPLEKDAVVPAAELAAHYHANAALADGRYRKRTFKVQGEIVSFDKPPLVRNYNILLKTAEPQTRVICDFYPPEKFKAVYTINTGTALVGILPGDARVPIAKIGEVVIIEGRCKGLSGGGVKLTDCEMKVAR